MKTSVVIITLLGLVVNAAPGWAAQLVTEPEGAEVETPAPRGGVMDRGGSVDIDLKIGLNSFRFGSRLFGRDGYSGGAWLNGETRPDGFSVDGRIERDGKVHNFKLNADIDEWIRRAVRWRSLTDL